MNPYTITAPDMPYAGADRRTMLGSGLLTPAAEMMQNAAYQQGAQDAIQQAAQNITGAAKADAAFNDGAAQAKQEHIDNQTATMERGLVGAKQAYMDAKYRGDQQGMANAYQTAQGIRANAKKQGIDLSRFDTNVALEEANKAYQQDAAANAMQNLRNSHASLAPGLLGYLANERPAQQASTQAASAAQQEYQPLNQIGRMMATQLLGYKDAWQQAHDANDAAGMQAAAESAAMLRDKAKQAGIDLTPYDGDHTAAQARAALQADFDLGLGKSLFGAPTSSQYYDQMFDWARQHGASEGEAQHFAQQKAARYQANRMADLQAAFYNYGLDPNGGISANGAHIMSLMRGEDPQSIGLENAYFTKPSDQWLFDRKREAATLQQALQMGLIDKQTAAQLQLLSLKGDIQKALQAQDIAGKKDITRMTIDGQLAGIDKKIAAAARAGRGGTGGGSGTGGGRSGAGGMTPSMAASIIKSYNDYADKHPGEANPWEDYLPEAQNTMDTTSGIKHDYNDYNYILKDWTNVLEGNDANMRQGSNYYSREQLENYARERYGDMAGNVLEGTDWGAHGLE